MVGRVADAAAADAITTYPLLYSRDLKAFITKAHMSVMHTHHTQPDAHTKARIIHINNQASFERPVLRSFVRSFIVQ